MKRYFGKIDLFALSLWDKLTLILYSFDFDLEKKILKKKERKKKRKKNLHAHTYSKTFVEDNQTIIFLGLI